MSSRNSACACDELLVVLFNAKTEHSSHLTEQGEQSDHVYLNKYQQIKLYICEIHIFIAVKFGFVFRKVTYMRVKSVQVSLPFPSECLDRLQKPH